MLKMNCRNLENIWNVNQKLFLLYFKHRKGHPNHFYHACKLLQWHKVSSNHACKLLQCHKVSSNHACKLLRWHKVSSNHASEFWECYSERSTHISQVPEGNVIKLREFSFLRQKDFHRDFVRYLRHRAFVCALSYKRLTPSASIIIHPTGMARL